MPKEFLEKIQELDLGVDMWLMRWGIFGEHVHRVLAKCPKIICITINFHHNFGRCIVASDQIGGIVVTMIIGVTGGVGEMVHISSMQG
jgi:hypothetical protein